MLLDSFRVTISCFHLHHPSCMTGHAGKTQWSPDCDAWLSSDFANSSQKNSAASSACLLGTSSRWPASCWTATTPWKEVRFISCMITEKRQCDFISVWFLDLFSEVDFYSHQECGEAWSCQLLSYIMGCLYKSMLYDTEGFVNKELFTLMLQPLVDQVQTTFQIQTWQKETKQEGCQSATGLVNAQVYQFSCHFCFVPVGEFHWWWWSLWEQNFQPCDSVHQSTSCGIKRRCIMEIPELPNSS